MDSKIYPRASGNQVFKGSGSICIVGRILSYNAANTKMILQTNEEPNLQVEIVFKKVENENELQKGSILQARGFGIDNKKLTCQSYTVFEGSLDLKSYNQTLKLMSSEGFTHIFSS